MAIFYVDSSIAVGAIFGDSAAVSAVSHLRSSDQLFSSPLLEAEVIATLRRERLDLALADELLDSISWVTPTRSLRPEIGAVLSTGYLRGADVWHLACALFLAGDTRGLRFLTADARQRAVAEKVGLESR